MSLEVHPLTPDRWDDLAVLFDRPGDARPVGWCAVPPTRPIMRRPLSGRGGRAGRAGSR